MFNVNCKSLPHHICHILHYIILFYTYIYHISHIYLMRSAFIITTVQKISKICILNSFIKYRLFYNYIIFTLFVHIFYMYNTIHRHSISYYTMLNRYSF